MDIALFAMLLTLALAVAVLWAKVIILRNTIDALLKGMGHLGDAQGMQNDCIERIAQLIGVNTNRPGGE